MLGGSGGGVAERERWAVAEAPVFSARPVNISLSVFLTRHIHFAVFPTGHIRFTVNMALWYVYPFIIHHPFSVGG